MARSAQPNILILMADQMAPSALPIYGHDLVRAPNMARLAAQGVVFDSAYCNSPLCAPSRFSFLSGRLPSRIGAYDNACEFPADQPTIAHVLRQRGYRAILAGKMHFVGPDQLHGFEERLTTDIYPADFGWTPDWTRFAERPSWYHSMDSVISAGPCIRTNQLDYDEEVSFVTRRKLFEIARGRDERPFFLVMSLTHPHDPFAIPCRYWDLYDDAAIAPPRVRIAKADQDPHALRLRHVCGLDLDDVTDAQVRAARHAYYGAISFVDEQIGTVLEALDDSGMADDTIILLIGDHGEMLGERDLWYKMNFFEGGARIPMIVHAPGRFAPHRVAASVSLLDLLPTLADLAGGAMSDDMMPAHDGTSLLPHLLGEAGSDEVIGEYLGEAAIAPIVMIRRDRWKFIHCPADPDQLFDLVADPDELANLASDPAHAATVAAFRREVGDRWDLPRIEAEVLASQSRRRLVAAATAKGTTKAWDYQPFRDAAQDYVRGHMDLEDLEASARFPRVRGE
ncbi:choline-sulfatase [uncultured Sphingomonas sp.]|uniref:choline-sulfatase n=1 Tax=uncultured Sphingomonas sp. TaxID=158754 RepID=UPI00260FF797|nr:choline-sulfatase [uncultured Sphingomonas sp.]